MEGKRILLRLPAELGDQLMIVTGEERARTATPVSQNDIVIRAVKEFMDRRARLKKRLAKLEARG